MPYLDSCRKWFRWSPTAPSPLGSTLLTLEAQLLNYSSDVTRFSVEWPPMELWWNIGGHRWISMGCQLGYLDNFFVVRFILLISPHTEKIQMGGWYHSICNWRQYLENRTPQPGTFVLIYFFDVYSKNNMKFSYFLKHFWNYFSNFSTHKKDTDGGLVPFDL